MAGTERRVNIRRNLEDYDDPYIQTGSPQEVKICSQCRSVYHDQRWYLREQVPEEVLKDRQIGYILCPACLKIRDRLPGGVIHLAGSFLAAHKEEILNLIRNEGNRAMAINPLERIIDIQNDGTGLEVLTTNEKLAQRIGRALHKAYDGNIKYRWSEDTKLARVSWERD